MRQEMISYLSTIENQLFELSTYLYENPETSFNEYKAYDYITNLLKEHNFCIDEHYLNIPTAFLAQIGTGHPKICYMCEYDALPNEGHVSGHNLISPISLGAALSLSKVISKVGGSIVVLGCPGEYVNGAKITMAKQGTFDDIDVALMVHPDIITAESGTSSAILPLKIEYKSKCGFSYKNTAPYSALDACLFTFNALNLIVKGLSKDCTIDGVVVKGGNLPSLLPCDVETNLYIRAPKMTQATEIERKIRALIQTTSSIMNMDICVSLYELPYDELISNSSLSRIFAHNLKESGIIDIQAPVNTRSGLSLGTVSKYVPCIHPFISITEDATVSYPSKDFATATQTPFAKQRAMKAAQALAVTGLDLIENQSLLQEIRVEFSEKAKNI